MATAFTVYLLSGKSFELSKKLKGLPDNKGS